MSRNPRIWLIEDNGADVLLLKEAFEAHNLNCELSTAHDGAEAIKLIESVHREEDCPNLIVLDLNLPKCSGHEILAQIRAKPVYEQVSVVVLSSSTAPFDSYLAARMGVKLYLHKPSNLQSFLQIGDILRRLLEDAA